MNIKDSKRFQELASGFQSAVFSFGLFCAGIWALFGFIFNQNTSLDLFLEVNSGFDENEILFAAVELNISNSGNKPVTLDIDESKLRVTRVAFGESGSIGRFSEEFEARSFYPLTSNFPNVSFKEVIPPNSNRKNVLITRLLEPGLYYFEFYSGYDGNPFYWYSASYANIGID